MGSTAEGNGVTSTGVQRGAVSMVLVTTLTAADVAISFVISTFQFPV